MKYPAIAQTHAAHVPQAPAIKTVIRQRQCVCGQHSSNGGECAECRKKRLDLQRKAVNQSEPTVPPIVHEMLSSTRRPLP